MAMSNLERAFEGFEEAKKSLKRVHEDTIKCFKQIVDKLAVPEDDQLRADLWRTLSQSSGVSRSEDLGAALEDVHISLGLTDELYTPNEKAEVERLFSQEPVLIFVGQTNSGKSSIINEFLGTKALPTSETPCTARIVHMTYSEKPFLELQKRDGTILEQIDLKGKSKVPRKKVELRPEDRADVDKTGAILKFGLNIDILKAGVHVIDTPGKSESRILDDLVNEQLRNVLPAIIYILDGHNLFTSQDRTALNAIMNQDKKLDIFYVVNKIEPETRPSWDDEQEVENVQLRKKRRVKNKLVKYGYLSTDDAKNNDRFYGLSAWKINKWNQLQRESPPRSEDMAPYREYIEEFERFKACLHRFYEESLRARIERVSSVLIAVLSRCLDFFIQKANFLQNETKTTISKLQTAKENEAIVHEAIIRDLKTRHDDIAEVLEERIQEAKEEVLQVAKDFEYDNMQITELTSDGFVSYNAAVGACVSQIKNMVKNRLNAEIVDVLQQMFASKDEFVKKLEEQVRNLETEARNDESTPSIAAHVLAQSLGTCYDLNLFRRSSIDDRLRSFWRGYTLFSRILLFKVLAFTMAIVMQPLPDPLWDLLERVQGKYFVGSPKWKEAVAKESLDAIKPDVVTKNLIKNIQEHFNGCHNQFAAAMDNIIALCKSGQTLKDQQRSMVRELAPDVAKLEMRAYSVLDKQKFGIPERGQRIGGGGQGTVYACNNIQSQAGKPCVVKVVQVSDEKQLNDLALELHNTRTLKHRNILPLVCTMIEGSSSRGYHVCLVSERLKWDLHEALPSLASLRTRLNIALEVATALQYLHKQGMIHRDVKTLNVLLDENNHAKLTDMGFCKPEGLATNSLVGTPLCMSPEMISTQKYDKTVDVYAFGVLLWHVCEGKGGQPQNFHKHCNPIRMLQLNAEKNTRPERLDYFHNSCWDLMEKCWSANPENRPSFDGVIAELQRILQNPKI